MASKWQMKFNEQAKVFLQLFPIGVKRATVALCNKPGAKGLSDPPAYSLTLADLAEGRFD